MGGNKGMRRNYICMYTEGPLRDRMRVYECDTRGVTTIIVIIKGI